MCSKTRIPSYSELVACAKRTQGSGITQVLPIPSSMQQEIPNKVEIDDNVVGTENSGENEEREKQAKSSHDLPMETTEVIEAYVSIFFSISTLEWSVII